MKNQEPIITQPELVGIFGKFVTLGILLILTLISGLADYSFIFWTLALVEVITFFSVLPAITQNISEKYSVDSKFIYLSGGLFTKETSKIPVRDIVDVSTSQTMIQKHFNIGSVFFKDYKDEEFSFDNIKEFQEIMELVSENMDQQKILYNKEDINT